MSCVMKYSDNSRRIWTCVVSYTSVKKVCMGIWDIHFFGINKTLKKCKKECCNHLQPPQEWSNNIFLCFTKGAWLPSKNIWFESWRPQWNFVPPEACKNKKKGLRSCMLHCAESCTHSPTLWCSNSQLKIGLYAISKSLLCHNIRDHLLKHISETEENINNVNSKPKLQVFGSFCKKIWNIIQL